MGDSDSNLELTSDEEQRVLYRVLDPKHVEVPLSPMERRILDKHYDNKQLEAHSRYDFPEDLSRDEAMELLDYIASQGYTVYTRSVVTEEIWIQGLDNETPEYDISDKVRGVRGQIQSESSFADFQFVNASEGEGFRAFSFRKHPNALWSDIDKETKELWGTVINYISMYFREPNE